MNLKKVEIVHRASEEKYTHHNPGDTGNRGLETKPIWEIIYTKLESEIGSTISTIANRTSCQTGKLWNKPWKSLCTVIFIGKRRTSLIGEEWVGVGSQSRGTSHLGGTKACKEGILIREKTLYSNNSTQKSRNMR